MMVNEKVHRIYYDRGPWEKNVEISALKIYIEEFIHILTSINSIA